MAIPSQMLKPPSKPKEAPKVDVQPEQEPQKGKESPNSSDQGLKVEAMTLPAPTPPIPKELAQGKRRRSHPLTSGVSSTTFQGRNGGQINS